jgi:hypothetical protein
MKSSCNRTLKNHWRHVQGILSVRYLRMWQSGQPIGATLEEQRFAWTFLGELAILLTKSLPGYCLI